MLGPDNRALLVDALRPPAGHTLDLAVGTTYSLDLEATLVPPVAFALFDLHLGEAGTSSDPISLLEAVRRHADRITIFCQAGQIANPAYQPILAYLESSIQPVTPPQPHRIFHPKLWALRFAPLDDAPMRYRLLCLTRNLTFARSWDTILQLEGIPSTVAARNGPLADFVAALPDCAIGGLDPTRIEAVRQLAEELRAVQFDIPDGFTDVEFWPLGLAERNDEPAIGAGRPMLVVSPFLTVERAMRLGDPESRRVLVSRPESLDAVGTDAVAGFDEVFTLSRNAVDAGSSEPLVEAAADEAIGERADVDLAGLHAKLYVVENATGASLFTGSANATTAAFDGNVEFLVELKGPVELCGIDALLGAAGENTSLRDLLQRYEPPTAEPQTPSLLEAAALHLERAAREMAAIPYTACVEAIDDDVYSLTLSTGEPLPQPPIPAALRCWPISLKRAIAEQEVNPGSPVAALFASVSLPAITSFFAFELTASTADGDATWTFVVNARLVGEPADRRERVLSSQLRSPSDVIRYLLFLLADIGGDPAEVGTRLRTAVGDEASPGAATLRLPLLESMVRALAESPTSLDHIARLVDDLSRSAEGRALMPPGLLDVWPPIWQARREAAS